MSDSLHDAADRPAEESVDQPSRDTRAPNGDDFTVTTAGGGGATTASSRPIHIPRTIGDYEVLGELGRGGMGVVYKARHLKLNRLCALKMVLAGGHTDSEGRARFLIEAEAVAKIQHANIVQIYEIGEHDRLPFFSLEYVEGGTLARKIAGQPQPPTEAARLMELLAQAIAGAHNRGIIHRDLKPANILLTSDGAPKIADFGLAKLLETDSAQTRTGTFMGTPQYMAPEQARGDVRQIGPAADVYALGVILYELLTGRTPFLGADVMDTVHQVLSQEPVAPRQLQPKVPLDLETISLQCLQKDPAKRYASASALARDLRHFLDGEPIDARPIGAAERAWRWCRRNPRVASLAATVFLLLATIAVTSSILLVRISTEQARTEIERRAAIDARDQARQSEAVARQEQSRAEEAQGLAVASEASAREAQRQAEAAGRAAQENAVIAGEQSRLAVNTLYSVVTTIQQRMRTQPGNQKLRQELLTNAFAGLEKVVSGAARSPLLDRTRAAAHQHMGDIAIELGQSDTARKHYEACRAIIEAMAAVEPWNQITMWNLAVAHSKLGALLRTGGDTAAAGRHFLKSLELEEALERGPLTAAEITPAMVRSRLIRSYSTQANTARDMGDSPASWKYLQKLFELQDRRSFATPREALVAARAPDAGPSLAGVPIVMQLANLSFHMRDIDAARSGYGAALDLQRAAVKRDAISEFARRDLASVLMALGDFELFVNDATKARGYYSEAHDLIQAVAARDPESAILQQMLSTSFYRVGTVALRLGDLGAADRAYRECLKLRQASAGADPRNTHRQIDLMLIQARSGAHAEAAELAQQLRAGAPDDPSILIYVSASYAMAAHAAGAGMKKDTHLQQQYTAAALETLGACVARGYRDVVTLEVDPDFDAIRSHPRFQAISTQLAKR